MNLVCVICSDLLVPSDDVFHTPCGHIFHFTCLVQWLERSKTCPQCRVGTTEQMIHKIYFNFSNDDSIVENSTSLRNKIDNLTYQLKLRDKDISNLTDVKKQLKTEKTRLIAEIRREKDNKRITITEFKKQIKHQNDDIDNYKKKIEEQKTAVEKLRKQLEEQPMICKIEKQAVPAQFLKIQTNAGKIVCDKMSSKEQENSKTCKKNVMEEHNKMKDHDIKRKKEEERGKKRERERELEDLPKRGCRCTAMREETEAKKPKLDTGDNQTFHCGNVCITVILG